MTPRGPGTGIPAAAGIGGTVLSRGRWVDRLAARLGVSATALKAALLHVREATPRTDRRTEQIRVLAAGLGRSEAQVRTALTATRPAERPRTPEVLAGALARELGLDAERVRTAMETVEARRTARGRLSGARGVGQALAEELGVDVVRLREAIRAVDGPRRARRGDAQDIAAALAVDVCDVRRVLEAHRRGEADRHEARQEAFAAALAQELGMPVAQVSDALSAMPARRGRRRR
jgi:plasmid stability protein